MNISLLKKFSCYKNYYQVLYALLIINIIIIIMVLLFVFKNKTILKYSGIVSNNNILVLSNLSYMDVGFILDSKQLKIKGENTKYKVLENKEIDDFYTLKLQLDKYYLDTKKLDIEVVLKEENLYEFVLKTMKGE